MGRALLCSLVGYSRQKPNTPPEDQLQTCVPVTWGDALVPGRQCVPARALAVQPGCAGGRSCGPVNCVARPSPGCPVEGSSGLVPRSREILGDLVEAAPLFLAEWRACWPPLGAVSECLLESRVLGIKQIILLRSAGISWALTTCLTCAALTRNCREFSHRPCASSLPLLQMGKSRVSGIQSQLAKTKAGFATMGQGMESRNRCAPVGGATAPQPRWAHPAPHPGAQTHPLLRLFVSHLCLSLGLTVRGSRSWSCSLGFCLALSWLLVLSASVCLCLSFTSLLSFLHPKFATNLR